MRYVGPAVVLCSLSALVVGACTVQNGSQLGEDDASSSSSENNGSNGNSGSGGGGAGLGTSSAGGGNPDCASGPDEDNDGDGYTWNTGDCNDCDPVSNPNSVEVLTPDGEAPADEDCDGIVDEAPDVCDGGIAAGDPDPMNAAKAIDLCKQSTNESPWGVMNAAYVRANGAPSSSTLGNGILANVGASVVPQHGDALLYLSSGNARDAAAPEACGSMSCQHTGAGTPPPGFPAVVPGCNGGTTINDDVALELAIRAPGNAKGYSFNFAFASFEFPEWVCTEFNDQFVALVEPAPMGAINGNISFDSLTNPVSVNIALFDNCNPSGIGQFAQFCELEAMLMGGTCPQAPQPYCPLGDGFMSGTGFNEWGDSGSTGWLVTTAPIGPNEEFTIRFTIWDTGDTNLDSAVEIDNFQFTADAGTSVGTDPIPDPK